MGARAHAARFLRADWQQIEHRETQDAQWIRVLDGPRSVSLAIQLDKMAVPAKRQPYSSILNDLLFRINSSVAI
jgi:hypothetical protein